MDYSGLEKHYALINDSTYIQNKNQGVIVTNETQSSLSFNTGQMYNKGQQKAMSTPSSVHADSTLAQSNFMNGKNIF